ncbi:hypothetical protein BDV95DRAFT_501279, partial [Massariosphaeria phaeospora]
IVVKAFNNTASLNSFVLTFLIFKVYFKININFFSLLNLIARANAVRKAIKIL